MCGTNTSPSPLHPENLFHDVILKKLLNSVCEVKWIRVTEWGLLLVSCLEQGSEINDIFRLGGTSLPKLPLGSPPGISGVDTPHIRFCTTALDVKIKQWNINIDEWVSKLTKGTYLLHCVKTNNLSTHNITGKMNKQKLRIKICQNIVNWVEWLWNPSDSFVICFCGPESAQRSKEFLSFWLYWPIKTLH